MVPSRLALAFSCLLTAILAAACTALPPAGSPPATASPTPTSTQPLASPPASPSPSVAPSPTSPIPSPTPTASALTVTSEAQAAALVFASNPIFSSIRQRDSQVIGNSMDFSTITLDDGFGVSITLGSGDCPSGCINKHTWNYTVSTNGQVKLESEQGEEVDITTDPGTSDPAQITVRLVAGPTCSVERDPPDPSCAPRPVTNAEVVLRDPSGAEVARGTADENGTVTFSAPGGAYYVEASRVEGLMGQAASEAFAVPGGRTVTVTLDYETGIR